MPYPSLLHPEPLHLWQATADLYLHRRCSHTVLSQSLWVPCVLVVTKFVWTLLESMVGIRFDSKHEFAPPTILLGLLLCPWAWGISSQPLQCLPSCWALSDLDCGISPHSCSSATYVSLKLLYPPDDLILLSIYNNHLVPYYGFWLKVYFVWYKYSYFFLSVSICIEYLFLCLHFWVCVFLKLQSLL